MFLSMHEQERLMVYTAGKLALERTSVARNSICPKRPLHGRWLPKPEGKWLCPGQERLLAFT